jgi:hypothetical protein
MWSSRWLIVGLLGLGATACGILELGGIGQVGETTDAASPVGQEAPGRWTVPVRVDPEGLDGIDVDVVELRFHADTLACQDGAVIRPEAIAAGSTVTFERVADEEALAAADPPVIAADEVLVTCPDEDPST